jgi:hypothetical protein
MPYPNHSPLFCVGISSEKCSLAALIAVFTMTFPAKFDAWTFFGQIFRPGGSDWLRHQIQNAKSSPEASLGLKLASVTGLEIITLMSEKITGIVQPCFGETLASYPVHRELSMLV